MLHLLATGKCEGCPKINPEVERAFANGDVVEIIVHCIHESLCDRIEDHLIRELHEENPGDS